MKSRLVCSLFAIAFCVTQVALAQSVERPRPAGWDRIVPGGRFMDRFEESQPIGPLTSECWGGDNVKPRDVRNGMEEPDYSYWAGTSSMSTEGTIFSSRAGRSRSRRVTCSGLTAR